ncbi:hypothetical protein GLYMA_02G156851v4 [Glycine max]|nr:hypothetical protein GLYMA_02G156851v4 [Glycine max]KAH1060538.1 hypothetical protein GYH30_004147 [Glycine max]
MRLWNILLMCLTEIVSLQGFCETPWEGKQKHV